MVKWYRSLIELRSDGGWNGSQAISGWEPLTPKIGDWRAMLQRIDSPKMFPSYSMGATATPPEKDELQKLYDIYQKGLHIGKP
jgi:hypothetical protein